MAAQQAVPLSEKEVIAIESKTIPQGVSAMLAFDPCSESEENKAAMTDAMSVVTSGQVTFAARDSDFDGKEIHEGDFMCLCEGKLIHNSNEFESVIEELAKRANMPDDIDVRRTNTCDPIDFLQAGLDIDYILQPRNNIYSPRMQAYIKRLQHQK